MRGFPWIVVIGASLLLVASVWFTVCQWQECREAGLSRFYCVKHISG